MGEGEVTCGTPDYDRAFQFPKSSCSFMYNIEWHHAVIINAIKVATQQLVVKSPTFAEMSWIY
jgi:hypothetical protein